MKIIGIIFGFILVTGLAIYLWGRSLPAVQEVRIVKEIDAPIHKVWQVMTDWGRQPDWRSDVKRVEIISDNEFIEYPEKGQPIHFRVTSLVPHEKINLTMSGSFEGLYVVNFIEKGEATELRVYEKVQQQSILFRILAKWFFDLDEFAHRYLEELSVHVRQF